MKSDINLLQKPKGKKYSAQRWLLIVLLVVLGAGAVYAGFMLPAKALNAKKLVAAALDSQLAGASGTDQDITVLTEENNTLSAQLIAIEALDAVRADINGYLDAVESALPASANISSLEIVGQTLSITGIAPDDETIAVFCLQLRDTGKFSYVFVNSSATDENGDSAFSINAEMPFTLDSASILPQETEETQDADAVESAETGAGQ